MTIEEIVRNKATLIAQKKAAIKYADGCIYASLDSNSGEMVSKSSIDVTDINEIEVKAAINTTNILDSHGDVHIKGLWNKSLKENKMIMHIQEHQLKFDKIIADGKDLKTSVKTMSFKELGYKMDGDTQVLFFDSIVKRNRNLYMFKQYADGNVQNHSVSMRYVKMELAVNNEDYKEEFAVWQKYYDTIANKSDAEALGYFWAIKEAKIIEGSAVPIGSNKITPTLEVNEAAKTGTSKTIEPPEGTQKISKSVIINILNS